MAPTDLAIDRPATLGDWWSRGYSLRARCQCGADCPIPAFSVLKLFGQEHHFHDPIDNARIEKVLVCGTCGQKGLATVRVVKE